MAYFLVICLWCFSVYLTGVNTVMWIQDIQTFCLSVELASGSFKDSNTSCTCTVDVNGIRWHWITRCNGYSIRICSYVSSWKSAASGGIELQDAMDTLVEYAVIEVVVSLRLALVSSPNSVAWLLMSLLLFGTSIGNSLCNLCFPFLAEKKLCNACLLLLDNFMSGMSHSDGGITWTSLK